MSEHQDRGQSIQELLAAIDHLEGQRAALGDTVVDASVGALQEKIRGLQGGIEQQRKQVTVLFADVSGFTAMSETMDAEDVTALINALWERLDQTIAEQGGRIDKHIGDAVMAIWGTETAREDDPERAIRAALAMRATLAALSQDPALDSFAEAVKNRLETLALRIGISTGPVLLGQVGTTGEYTAMGDTVNLASRLEEAAPVGGILISHDTYRHVRGLLEVQTLDPLQVKGKREPVQVYLVEGAKTQGFRLSTRGIEGIETRMVGREAELERLQQALLGTIQQRRLHMITVVGEAGIGKSRLLYEFENWAELLPQELYYFKGRARQEIQNQPYALLRDLFAFRLHIQESDSPATVRVKLERGLGEMLGDDDHAQMQAHFIGQLLGFDFGPSVHLAHLLGTGQSQDPQQLRDRASGYLVTYFQRAAAQDPALILLEDYHWADDSSLDLLQHLAQALEGSPLLIVGLARPAFLERRPGWGQDQPFHRRLDLHPLSADESRRLVAEILRQLETLPPILEDVVVGKAEGNPFYVEELLKMLIEDGVIVKDTPHWRVEPARLAEVRVPPTLTGILQARLDSLPPVERSILQRASVVGRVFWEDLIQYLSRNDAVAPTAANRTPLQRVLDTLCERELIFPRRASAFAETQEYIFKHAMLRDVTYESVLKRERRLYHAQVAEWLIAQSGERAGEYAGLIAEHLERAGQIGQAVAYLQRAGEAAAARFANIEAVRYFSRALELVPGTDPARRYQLLSAREKVYDLQGQREAQQQDLQSLQQLVERGNGDNLQQAEVALRWAYYYEAIAQYDRAVAAAKAAIAAAEAAVDPSGTGEPTRLRAARLQAEGYLRWGTVISRQGFYQEGKAQLEQALRLARSAGARAVEADALSGLGGISWYQNQYAEARRYFEQVLQICHDTGDMRGQGQVLNNLGVIPWAQGDYAEAKTFFEHSLRIHRQIGDEWGQGISLNNLGLISLSQGDLEDARDYYEQSMRIYQQVGDRHGVGTALNNLGVVYRSLGDYAQSRDCYERCLGISLQIGDRRGEALAQSNLSLVLHNLGQDRAALEAGQTALAIAREIGNRDLQAEALTNLGHTMSYRGDLDEAEAAYRESLSLRRELDLPSSIMETLAGLACISLARADLERALSLAEEILGMMAHHSIQDAEEPLRVYLTCYQVLHAAQDPRAGTILAETQDLLQEWAGRIDDETLRRSFLENVAAHREIGLAFSRLGAER